MNVELKTRRVITGHDSNGKAIIIADETLEGQLMEPADAGGNKRLAGLELWGTSTSPVDNSDDALPAQKQGWRGHTEEGKGQRSMFRVGRFPPGHIAPMHRTESVDYAILVEGECDLLLDSGQVTRLHAGDVVIQRGTIHSWVNRGDTPCTWFFILLDAEPTIVGETSLQREMGEAPDLSEYYSD